MACRAAYAIGPDRERPPVIAYPALLAAHLAAVALFLAGLFVTAALLPGLVAQDRTPARAAELRRLRLLNRAATTPALAALWALGVTMAVEGGWFDSGWLRVKIALVLLLSGWHGRQSGMLRRLAAGRPVTRAPRGMPALLAAATAAIVTLVVAKPF